MHIPGIVLGLMLLVALAPLGAPARAQNDAISITGVLTSEGVECPAVRGDDGALYTLTSRIAVAEFRPGDRVRITGRVTPMSRCQQGTAIVPDEVKPDG